MPTEGQLARMAGKTAAAQAEMRKLGFGCHCHCGCAYVLTTETSRTFGVCFSCRKDVHYGSRELLP